MRDACSPNAAPLNGFVSEWLTFQALLGDASCFHGPAGLVIVLSAAMLA